MYQKQSLERVLDEYELFLNRLWWRDSIAALMVELAEAAFLLNT
jgi:hypothetical protein